MEEYNLYNNTIKLYYDDAKHLYTVNGKKVDGVTSVLQVINKPALMYWAVNQAIGYMKTHLKPGKAYDEIQIQKLLDDAKYIHRHKKDEAANLGSKVHEWLDQHIKGEKPTPFVHDIMRRSCEKFLSWEKDNKVEFIKNERIVYSKQHNYAGTFDFLAKINGKLWLGDIKTSSGIWDEYWFQTAAYRQAYNEEYDEDIEGEIIVRVGKDGSLEVKDTNDPYVTNYKINRDAFNNALGLHRALNQLKDYKWQKKNGGGGNT